MKLPLRALALLIPLLSALAFRSADEPVPATPGIPAPPAPAASAVVAEEETELEVALGAALFGRSGRLRSRLGSPGEVVPVQLEWTRVRPARVEYRWVPVMGTTGPAVGGLLPGEDGIPAPERPGVYELELLDGSAVRRFGEESRLVVRVPFEAKRNGYIGRYFMGNWPTEGSGRRDRYAPPPGFIEVTRENQELRLSEHFKLKEFLTHDQGGVWPKYVVVDYRLLDKLELVMDELNASGVTARHMIVMSGFRTPQYNRKGLSRGRASLSRHQFGDAADVWVDNDGDWYMDDLNGDGRRDTRDSRVILKAVERVEARHRELLGGAGIYPDNGAHGPFIHIDVRGSRARW